MTTPGRSSSTPSRVDYFDAMRISARDQRKDAWVGDWLIQRVKRGGSWLFVANHYTGITTPHKADAGEIATLMRVIDLGLAAIENEKTN